MLPCSMRHYLLCQNNRTGILLFHKSLKTTSITLFGAFIEINLLQQVLRILSVYQHHIMLIPPPPPPRFTSIHSLIAPRCYIHPKMFRTFFFFNLRRGRGGGGPDRNQACVQNYQKYQRLSNSSFNTQLSLLIFSKGS